MRIIKKIKNKLIWLYKLYVIKDKFTVALNRFYIENGDKLRYEYELNSESIVFDIGGFKGDFADKIFERYKCNICIFEPVNAYFAIIKKKFKNNGKIKIFNLGLGGSTREINITLKNDGSSFHRKGNNNQNAKIIDIYDFMIQNYINKIDLLKINIEGGEYELLNRLIEKDLIKICNNIQIQFHEIFTDANKQREIIRLEISKTHYLTYDYYFVWENWTNNYHIPKA